jgi:hypothetical protein
MVPFTPQSICLLLTPVSRPGSNFPAPPPAAQAAVTFAKYSADFPFAATRTDSLLSSSASYAAMHARAAQGTGSSLTSSSSSSAAAPRHTSQQAPRVHDRGSLDSTGTQPGPIPHRTKWLPAACLPARASGDGSCDGALDNALRASYEAIAQVDLLRVVCNAHMIASPQTRSAAAECGDAAVTSTRSTRSTRIAHVQCAIHRAFL